MDDNQAVPLSESSAPSVSLVSPGPTLPRWLAAVEVALLCGVPTQLIATIVVVGAGVPPLDGGNLSFEFLATLSLVDTAIVALLIRMFLSLSSETSARVFIGTRPIGGEILRGFVWLPLVVLAVVAFVVALRAVAPWMHNVDTNPFEAYMRSPLEAGIFLVVVVLAGGVREELERAFILHRFEQRLGGVTLGLALFSLTFGALHIAQGFDVATAVGLLGLFWGLVYIKRRSVIAPMVNHAAFNAAQVAQVFLAQSLGT